MVWCEPLLILCPSIANLSFFIALGIRLALDANERLLLRDLGDYPPEKYSGLLTPSVLPRYEFSPPKVKVDVPTPSPHCPSSR